MLLSGMTSVTFRKYSPRKIVGLCKRASLSGIEWGGDIHVPHGDTATAKSVRALCQNEGVTVFSYGSYYSPTKYSDYRGEFEKVAETCLQLGCKTVRIWAGDKWRHEATDEEYATFIARMKDVAEIARRYAITVCFEHHQNTFCDSATHAKAVLSDIANRHVKTYWQPICPSEEDNLNCISLLKEHVVNVHVYHWTGWERHLLQEGKSVWKRYLQAFASGQRDIPCLLEFALCDREDAFLLDAACLNQLIKESSVNK